MMKRGTFVVVCLVLVFPTVGNAQKLDIASLNTERDKVTIENAISGYGKALSDLPNSRDVESILRFHATDFTGTEDGKEYNLKTVRETLNQILDSLKAGNSVAVSVSTRNIEVEVRGDAATATYDADVRLRVSGRVSESKQKCTDRFRREAEGWLLEHSAISVVRESANPREATVPTSTQTQRWAGPSPAPPVQPSHLIDETFNVAAGQFRVFEIRLNAPRTVAGRFDVGGGRFSDVKVFLIPSQEYDNLRNNRPHRYFYASGQVVSGSLNVPLPTGYYLLVFSNMHSVVAGATVRTVIDLAP